MTSPNLQHRVRAGRRLAFGLPLCLFGALPAEAAPLAPSVALFGSYFPSWLLCAILGVVSTVIVRVVFVGIGVDDILRWRVPAYAAMAVALGLLYSMVIFGR